MSLREKKKQETRNRIFEVSGKLFKEKGFQNTTIDEITKEAGIAKGTFFNYFPTKESLLYYFKEQKEEFLLSFMKKQLSLDIPLKKKLMEFFILLAEYYEKDKELSRLLFFEQKRLIMTSDHKHTGRGHKQKGPRYFITIMHELLQEGIEKGEIKKDIDPMIAASTLHAIYFHSLIIWLHSDTDYSFSGDISSKIDLLFTGIGE